MSTGGEGRGEERRGEEWGRTDGERERGRERGRKGEGDEAQLEDCKIGKVIGGHEELGNRATSDSDSKTVKGEVREVARREIMRGNKI